MEPTESISSLLAAMKSGTLTSTELVERCLARIETADRNLRAWVSVDASGARADAARADDKQAFGVVLGVLHGIPIGIKDIVDVAGIVTGAGSPLRIKSALPAERDAAIVTVLRQAGGGKRSWLEGVGPTHRRNAELHVV